MAGTLLLMLGSSSIAALSPLLLRELIDALDGDHLHALGIGAVYVVLAYALTQWLSKSPGELRAIAYNIAFGRQGSTHDEIVAAAKVAGIHAFILQLPHGYETRIGERGAKLSGGEKQRLALARAAIRRPEIFVFDEATSSLDTRSERAILRRFLKVAENTTVIIIAHRLSTVVHADEVIVLDRGSIIERGTHGALIRQRGAYAAMLRAQQEEAIRFYDEAARSAPI